MSEMKKPTAAHMLPTIVEPILTPTKLLHILIAQMAGNTISAEMSSAPAIFIPITIIIVFIYPKYFCRLVNRSCADSTYFQGIVDFFAVALEKGRVLCYNYIIQRIGERIVI